MLIPETRGPNGLTSAEIGQKMSFCVLIGPGGASEPRAVNPGVIFHESGFTAITSGYLRNSNPGGMQCEKIWGEAHHHHHTSPLRGSFCGIVMFC